MSTPTELEWQSLTQALDETRTPFSFVTQLLFNRSNTNPTEKIAIDTIVGGRRMAPFVSKGSQAALIPGQSAQFTTVEAPNISAKRPFSAGRLLFERAPGTPIFVTGDTVASAVARRIAGDVKYAREQIDQTVEWMACQALTGVLTYNISTTDGQPGDAFTIDFGRPGAHTVTLSGTNTWDTADASATSRPRDHVKTIKELISDSVGAVTDCIMGSDAADAWQNNESIRADLDNRRVSIGTMNLASQFEATGAIFLGEVYGIRWWQYSRSVVDPFGNTVQLIGADKAHFVCNQPSAENVIEYGAIDDFDAMNAGMLESRVFSKAWLEKDPSAWMHLWRSRPLPIPKRPQSMVTYTVV